ncbi:hypothetical protein Clacol_008164 [Clathrus columnatus]|uniref:Trimethylguanosine synthase n=1 Tax=Clathrus columnatus TaxID=1419009 RepID=A0AAV5AGY4_9AGAM|nr:hypothetical protein Clacol_008164 [Clathrus columnatus]
MGKNKRIKSLLAGLSQDVLSSLQKPSKRNVAKHVLEEKELPPRNQVPLKRRKLTGLLGPGWEDYDATNLVPFYVEPSEVPQDLRKYFSQRERYFSLYNQGCLLDEQGWYSVTPEAIANAIADKCRCFTILDAFCGVGGNAIAFAQTCERVIAIDNCETRLRLARHNAVIYGVQDRIEFILGDYISFAKSYPTLPERTRTAIDVVFLSPPWGGINYISPESVANDGQSTSTPNYGLERIKPIEGADLFQLTKGITPHIAFYLPKHVDLEQVSALTKRETIEVQEAWMSNKLKAVTCYFGGLAKGQEHLLSS